MFLCTIGEQILFFPSMITSYARQDAWISSLLGVGGGLGILLIMLAVHRLNLRLNLIEHVLGYSGLGWVLLSACSIFLFSDWHIDVYP